MDKPITPEERLLRLIKEGGKPKKDEEAQETTPQLTPAAQRVEDTASIPKAAKKLKVKKTVLFFKRIDKRRFFAPNRLNRFLTIVLAVAVIYAVLDIVFIFVPSLKTETLKETLDLLKADKDLPKPEEKEVADDILKTARPLSEYTAIIQRRQLFKSVMLERAPKENQIKTAKVKLEEIAKGLAIKGIISGQPPQAVIEDIKTQKSFFVIEGDKLEGDIIVEQITEGKVRLMLDGERYDLSL